MSIARASEGGNSCHNRQNGPITAATLQSRTARAPARSGRSSATSIRTDGASRMARNSTVAGSTMIKAPQQIPPSQPVDEDRRRTRAPLKARSEAEG